MKVPEVGWMASTDGSTNYQYTQGEASTSSPAFSADGQYLAFLSARSEKNPVYDGDEEFESCLSNSPLESCKSEKQDICNNITDEMNDMNCLD